MSLKELADMLYGYIQKHPEDEDKEIYSMQLDIAATKDNTSIEDRDGMLFISNGIFGQGPQIVPKV